MTIALFGTASVPADNASQAGPTPSAVVPPASMQAGDYVLMAPHQRLGNRSENFDFLVTGGQAWTFVDFRDATVPQNAALWMCRFNGTWSANPQIEQGDGDVEPMTVPMLVLRPSSPSMMIDIDFSSRLTEFAAATTVTIPAITTRHNNAVAIALWFSNDDNTWGTLTGSVGTWTNAVTQIRNTNGSQMSFSAAYQLFATAGTTGTVSKTQSTSDPGLYCLFSIYERDATQDFASVPAVDLYVDFEQSTDGTALTAPIITSATRMSSADGSWSISGAGGPNVTIESDAQKALSPKQITVSGTPYTDASGTRGIAVDHNNQNTAPYIFTWQKTSGGYAKASAGCWLYTELDYGLFSTVTIFGLQESGGTMGGFIGIPNIEAAFHRLQLENAPSETVIAANIQRNTWYWVSLQYDTAANVGSLRVYDTSFNQVGFSAVGRLTSGSTTNVNQLQLGDSHGAANVGSLKRTFYDNVIMDWTNGSWPLGPADASIVQAPYGLIARITRRVVG